VKKKDRLAKGFLDRKIAPTKSVAERLADTKRKTEEKKRLAEKFKKRK
jgi:hypothetical protein